MSRIIVALAIVALGGCNTAFNASAPAAQSGMEYVVGARGGFFSASNRTIWLCPVGQASAECRRVEVND